MITCTTVNTTNTTIYTSSGANAVNLLIFCNTDTDSATLTVYVVPNGSVLSDKNTIIKLAVLPSTETLTFSSEKLILANGDTVVAKAVNTSDGVSAVDCQATVSSISL